MIIRLGFLVSVICGTAFSAPTSSDIARVNGVRFNVIVIDGAEIFVPADESLGFRKKLEMSFCRNHLDVDDDYIKIRSDTMLFTDEEKKKLVRICKDSNARSAVPSKTKTEGASNVYDHRNADSVKSVIDYIIKKH